MKRNGTFDNIAAQRCEVWIDGRLVGQWPALKCANVKAIEAATGWEKQALADPWGKYSDLPVDDQGRLG